MRVLRLLDVHRGTDNIVATCAFDDLRFHVSIWYEAIDLGELARRHGDELIERLAVHIALFQLVAACSLRPGAIELGRYARYLTPELLAAWHTVFRNVWAQWRWEHDLPPYDGPRFIDQPSLAPAPSRVPDGETELLAFSSGGKDSLVAAKLLERAGLPFATLASAHSIYGPAAAQHALLERVASVTTRTRSERLWVIDDLLDAPIAALRPELGVTRVLAAETPASLFAALPIALARGYRGLVVPYERAVATAYLEWGSEPVTREWGKSWDAERMLDAYIRTSLLSNVRYFSVLQSVHHEVIFELLARDAVLAPLTHSCDVRKPWCGACTKCAYVWLQMAAHLPADIVRATFPADVGEDPRNLKRLRQLLGIGEHTPFECVGGVAETRVALASALRNGWTGPQLAGLSYEVGPIELHALAAPLVELGPHGMPPHVADGVLPQLADAASTAAARLGVR
jgi:hypothetical protein